MTTQVRVPNFDDSVEFTPSTGSSNYDMIDSYPGYDDSDYNYTTAPGNSKSDRFAFDSFTVPAGATISKVTLGVRCRIDGGGDCWARLTLNNWSESDVAISPGGDFGWVYADWTTNPGTGSPWTVDEVNSVGTYGLGRIGYMYLGGDSWTCYVSELYVQVEYTGGSTSSAFIV